MSPLLGLDVTANRDPGSLFADLCRHWYGEGFCISPAIGGFCAIHQNTKAARQSKPVGQIRHPAKPKAPAQPAEPANWPKDEREQAAMEYLGLSPSDKRLGNALFMWRAGHRLAVIRGAIGE